MRVKWVYLWSWQTELSTSRIDNAVKCWLLTGIVSGRLTVRTAWLRLMDWSSWINIAQFLRPTTYSVPLKSRYGSPENKQETEKYQFTKNAKTLKALRKHSEVCSISETQLCHVSFIRLTRIIHLVYRQKSLCPPLPCFVH